MTKKNKFSFYLPEHGESVADAIEFETVWDKDNLEEVAVKAAEYHHDNCDGWESAWPLEFVILDETGELGRFNVEREHSPEFYATKKKIIGGL